MSGRNLLVASCFVFAVLTFGAGCAANQRSDAPDKLLFNRIDDGAGTIEQAQKPRIVRHRFVSVEFDLLSGTLPFEEKGANGSILVLNLFDDATFKAVLDRREVRSDKSFTWFGRVEGIENSQITLVVEDGVLVGNIRVRDAYYQVRYAGEGIHVVYQIDPLTFPPDSKPVVVPGKRQ